MAQPVLISLFWILSFSLALSANVPAVVQTFNFLPGENCDLEQPKNQSLFSGNNFEFYKSIIEGVEWPNDQYEVEFYCISTAEEVINAAITDFYIQDPGRTYLLTS
jgi:hypothetical protein